MAIITTPGAGVSPYETTTTTPAVLRAGADGSTTLAVVADTATGSNTSVYVSGQAALNSLITSSQPGVFEGANVTINLEEQLFNTTNQVTATTNYPSGNTGEIQYNSGANSFASDAYFTYTNSNVITPGIRTNNYLYANGAPFLAGGNAAIGNFVFTGDNMTISHANSTLSVTGNGTGNVNVTANGNIWTFGSTGILTLPGGPRIVPVGANLELQAADDGYAEIVTSDGNNYVAVTTSGAQIVTSGINTWTFDNVGNLILPGNTFAVKYANGDTVAISSGGFPLANGTSNIDIATANGNVTVGVSGNTWTFDNTSALIFPSNAEITSDMTGAAVFQHEGGVTIAETNGNSLIYNTVIELFDNAIHLGTDQQGNAYSWDLSQDGSMTVPGNISGANVITANVFTALSNVSITSSGNTWTFNTDGNLILPGNIIAINYANGNRVTGNITFRDEIVIGTGTSNLISGLYLAPSSSSADANMYLRVRGNIVDEPTHIHFDTGNNQYYNQFIGDDNKYIQLANTGNIVINSNDGLGNSAQWTFAADGNLTVPGDIVSANLIGTNSISAAGNVFGNNINANSDLSAFGNVYANSAILNFLASSANLQVSGTANVGALSTVGSVSANGNITTLSAMYSGNGATWQEEIALANVLFVGADVGNEYIQAAMINTGGNGSADWVSYSNNGNTDQGWIDMGITGNTFNDPDYELTDPNDGYILVQGTDISGTPLGGNLILATGNTGLTHDIVFATGGFTHANIKARLIDTTGEFSVVGNIVANNLSATNLVINSITSDDSTVVTIEDGLNVIGDVDLSGNLVFSPTQVQSSAYAGGNGHAMMIDTNRTDDYVPNGSSDKPFKTFAAAIAAVALENPTGTVPYTFILMGCNINETVDFTPYNFNFITISTTCRSTFNDPVIFGNSALLQLTIRNVEFGDTVTILGDGTANQFNNTSIYNVSFVGALTVTAVNAIAFYEAAFFSTVVFNNVSYCYVNGAQFNDDWTIRVDDTGAYPIPSGGIAPGVVLALDFIANDINFVKGGTGVGVFQPHSSRMGRTGQTYALPASWILTSYSSAFLGTWTNDGTWTMRNSVNVVTIANTAPTYSGTIGGTTITATGNITGGNLTLSSTTGNIIGHDITLGGTVSATGNVTANNGMFTNIVNVASHTGAVVSVSGNVTGGNISAAGLVNTGSFVTGTIPAAAGAGAGSRAFVTDADSITFGNLYVGGSGNAMPVWSNGTNWYIG